MVLVELNHVLFHNQTQDMVLGSLVDLSDNINFLKTEGGNCKIFRVQSRYSVHGYTHGERNIGPRFGTDSISIIESINLDIRCGGREHNCGTFSLEVDAKAATYES